MNRIGFKIKEEDVKEVNQTIKDIKETAKKVLGTIGIGFALVNMNEIIEEFGRINDQVRNSTSALGDQAEIQQKILAAATATRSAYGETAKMVSNLVHENSELFGTVDEAIKFNNAATMLFKTAGKTNEDIAGLMEAINKSFAKGYVDSETLSQLLERSPEAVELLNKQLGTTSDQLEQMATDGKFTVADLKAAFVDNAEAIEAGFGNVKMRISDALTVIRNQWGLWLTETNDMLEITSTIGTVMVKGFNMAIGAITKVRNAIVWLSDKLGGVDKLLKIVAITAGTIFTVTKFGKIKAGLSNILSMIGAIRIRTLAIIAVFLLVALLVEDFFNFMRGNDSLIGTVLERAGVDLDKFRENVIKTWENVKVALSAIWQGIKNVAIPIFQGIWQFIKTVFKAIGDVIVKLAPQVADFLDQLANGNVDTEQWVALGEVIAAIGAIILSVVMALKICSAVIGIVNAVMAASPIFWIIAAIVALIAVIALCVKHWDDIKAAAQAAWDGICNAFGAAAEWFNTNIIQPIVNFFTGLWESITSIVSNIKQSVVDGFTAAIDWIKSLPAQALTWGADIIQGIVDGIKGAIGKVGEAVKGVADKIKSFLGFSEPEDGPLSNFHTYMPDMIDLMSKGIKAGKDKVKAALGELTGDMSVNAQVEPEVEDPDVTDPKPEDGGNRDRNPRPGPIGGGDFFGGLSDFVGAASELIQAGKDKVKGFISDFGSDLAALAGVTTVSPATASSVTSTTNNRSVVQNVNFSNQFNGDKAIQQQTAKAMDRSAKDVTAELARGLAYAR